MVRPVALLTQDSSYQSTAISNFAILDSASSNCVGGQPIPSALPQIIYIYSILEVHILDKLQLVVI